MHPSSRRMIRTTLPIDSSMMNSGNYATAHSSLAELVLAAPQDEFLSQKLRTGFRKKSFFGEGNREVLFVQMPSVSLLEGNFSTQSCNR